MNSKQITAIPVVENIPCLRVDENGDPAFMREFRELVERMENLQTQHLIKYIEGLKIKEPSELVGLYKKDETRSVSIGSFGGDWYNYALSDILDYLRNK